MLQGKPTPFSSPVGLGVKNVGIVEQVDGETKIVSERVIFEKFKHNIEISVNNGEVIVIRKTLDELMKMIDNDAFVYAHKSAVVNLKYVDKIIPTDMILETGQKIPISRRNYQSIKLAFSKYIGGLL